MCVPSAVIFYGSKMTGGDGGFEMIGGNLVLLLPFFVSLFCYYFVEYMLQVARCFVVAETERRRWRCKFIWQRNDGLK